MSSAGNAPTKEDIFQAIRNADAAGDSASVQRLSEYLTQMDATPGAPAAAPQDQSWERYPKLVGNAIGHGVAGLVGLPGTINDLTDKGLSAISGGKVRLPNWLPTIAQSNAFTDQIGLTDRPEATPTSVPERYGSALVEAIPNTLATIGTGGLGAVPALATGAASALASQGAHDLAPDSAWAPIAAGLVSGLGVGGITGQVENVLKSRAVNKLVDSTASDVASAAAARDKAASELENAKDAAFQGRNDLGTNVANVKSTSRADFAATREHLETAKAENHAQQDAVVEDIAGKFGKSETLQEAGTALQSHARNWLTNVLPDKLEAAWAPVASAIPKDMKLALVQFQSALDSITKSAGELEPLAALLKPSLPAKLAAKLKDKGDLADLTSEGPVEAGAPLEHSWQDVSKLRSALGDAMSNPKTVADIGVKNMSRLYAALTTDMRVGADRAGATGLFDEANAESQRLYQIAEGPMAKVVSGPRVSAEDLKPEAVAKSLLSGAKSGGSDLSVLRNEIPQGVNELAAAHLRLDPKSFARLPPESLGALSPDASHTATALGALGAKEAATQAAKQGFKLAQQTHQANVALAEQAAREGNFANASAVRSSGKGLKAARDAHSAAQKANAEAVAKQKALPGNSLLDHSGSTITGAILGEPIGEVLDPLLFGNSGIGKFAGAAAGALAPKIIRGGVNLLRPKAASDLAYPLLGTTVGANALYGKTQ